MSGATITLDYGRLMDFIPESALEGLAARAGEAQVTMLEGRGAGADFLGWKALPDLWSGPTLAPLVADATRLGENCENLVVAGIGGSYLGTRAVFEALCPPYYNLRDRSARNGRPRLFFAGHHIAGEDLASLLDVLGKDFSVVVISKSGTTTEPALAFRVLKERLESLHGKAGARDRIVAITDSTRGALRTLADAEGYSSYVIPDDVGGRFSVFSPVGLFPLAAVGVDLEALLEGARAGTRRAQSTDLKTNPALMYAALRNQLYALGKTTEILVNFLPALHYVAEWWKQLFGESEGKEGRGIFPAAVDFTTDLHSMGQWIQEGNRIIFETMLWVEQSRRALAVPMETTDRDGLNYLAGEDFTAVNKEAFRGTVLAHHQGGVPVLVWELRSLDARCLGEMLALFEWAVGVGGYMLGVNPFNQPGVEAYKSNMFALLGKPGFEEKSAALRESAGAGSDYRI